MTKTTGKEQKEKKRRSIDGRGLLTVGEAAKYFYISKSTFVAEYLKTYKIGVIIRNGRKLIAIKHLDAFIDENTQA